jgi:Zn finger protein HypA/HybF involved in hydrogenase expression
MRRKKLSHREALAMGKCLKGESEVKKKDAKFECGKCGARTEKKAHVCKPEKIKGDKKK